MRLSPLRLILLVCFCDLISFGLIIPLQAVYAERLGAKGVTFGLLVGCYALMQMIFNPILGRWSDRVGRRPVLLISVAGSVASHILLGVADLAQSLPLLFAARLLDGITGANIATAQAYIADVTTAENRTKGMGLFGAAFGAGFVLGPAISALLVTIGRSVSGPEQGTCWPAFGAAATSAIALFLIWRHLPEPPRAAESPDRRRGATHASVLTLFRSRHLGATLRHLLIIVFAVTFAFVLMESTLVYLLRRRFELDAGGIGLGFACIGLVMIVVQGGLVSRLSKRFGERKLVTTGPFVTGTGFLLLAAVMVPDSIPAAWWILIAGCIVMTVGHGLTGPNLNALTSKNVASGAQGGTFGLSQAVASLARAISPPIGGLLFDCGPSWPYAVGAVVFVCTGVFGAWAVPADPLARGPDPMVGDSHV